MIFSDVKTILIPEGPVAKILCGNDVLWKKQMGYKNWARYSTETDGTTIYNNGQGYKDGYRIRSGGAETANASSTCTGFIPVKGGSVIRIAGATFNSANAQNAINVANSSFTNIGQVARNGNYGIFIGTYSTYGNISIVEELDGVWRWVVPPVESGVAYIRITGETSSTGGGANLIITVDEGITL